MDHLLLVDEVGGLADQSHEGVEVVGPLIEDLTGVLGLSEGHHPSRPVDSGIDGLLDHQLSQELL